MCILGRVDGGRSGSGIQPKGLKDLDRDHAICHSQGRHYSTFESLIDCEEISMQRSVLAMAAAVLSAILLSAGTAQAGPYPFGDEPYRFNWGYDPAVASGCLKWNWQLHQWNDHCPRYAYPKAFMHPRPPRVVLRTKG
jgi:hypothetical protein